MKNNIVILGGGLSGKIAKYLLRGKNVLIGSQPTFNYGLFYVHRFLNNDLTQDKIRIRTVTDYPGTNAHEEYCMRTRGHNLDLNLSIDRVQENAIGWRLNKKALPYIDLEAKVTEIDVAGKCITFKGDKVSGKIKYDVLINTIPLPDFIRLLNEGFRSWDMAKFIYDTKFDAIPVGLKYKRFPNKDLACDVKVVYLPSDDPKAYRASGNDEFSVYEYSFAFGDNAENKIYDKVLYPGKLIHSDNTPEILQVLKDNSIYSVGRYAKWDQRVLVHDAYDDVIKIKNELGI